jgi:guanine nucleotide-binding protein subunit alpha
LRFNAIFDVSSYFSKIDTIASSDYLPDNQDILRARLRTTGIVENTFVIEKVPFT